MWDRHLKHDFLFQIETCEVVMTHSQTQQQSAKALRLDLGIFELVRSEVRMT